MNKKTVEEAIKQGLKIGDEVWVKGEVLKIEEDVVPLCLGLEKKNRYWFKDGDEIYLPTDTAPEWLTLAECEPCVGDVLEWLHECQLWDKRVSSITNGLVYFGGSQGYLLGSDVKQWLVKSRAAQPEQWQPKEGELVWSKGNKIKMKAHYNFNGNVFYTGEKGYIGGGVFEIEPYANQDAKIDFSIAGQWVRCGNTIVQTSGTHDKGHVYVYFLGDGLNEAKKVSKLFKWQLLTPEQMKPLLDAYSAITESQSD